MQTISSFSLLAPKTEYINEPNDFLFNNILDKYNQEYIGQLELIIYKQHRIQKTIGFSSFNTQRSIVWRKYCSIKASYKRNIKKYNKVGLKTHYNSKKEYETHIKNMNKIIRKNRRLALIEKKKNVNNIKNIMSIKNIIN
jgi:hypothetical protein